MMFRIFVFFILIYSVTFSVVAKSNFPIFLNDYCSYVLGEKDCSDEFMEAIKAGSIEKKPVVLQQGEVFLVESIDTTDLGLNGIEVLGVADEGFPPTIITDRMYLFDVNDLKLSNIRIKGLSIDVDSEVQGTSLVMTGGRFSRKPVSNITIRDVRFENSAEDLLAVWNAKNIEISGSEFYRSGLAMRIAPIIIPGDLRPRGSGAVFLNVEDLIVRGNEFHEIKKMGLFFGSEVKINKGIAILNNFFDLKSYEMPTQRYGLLGGAGIYIGNSPLFSDVLIQGNTILGFKMNGIRLNGENITVRNNFFNNVGDCLVREDIDPIGMAIKSHYLKKADILENCFHNVNSAISFESWQTISEVMVKNNKVFNTVNAFYASDSQNTIYRNISFDRNEIYGATGYAIALHSVSFSRNNSVTGNTLLNKVKSEAPMMLFVKQDTLYFDNNWLKGIAGSVRWNYVRINEVINSMFKRSFMGSVDGSDASFGGIYFEGSGSIGNSFEKIKFSKLNPGLHGNMIGNSVEGVIYE